MCFDLGSEIRPRGADDRSDLVVERALTDASTSDSSLILIARFAFQPHGHSNKLARFVRPLK